PDTDDHAGAADLKFLQQLPQTRVRNFKSKMGTSRRLRGQMTEAKMPKGYWIVRGEVTDPEGYKAYVAANAEAFGKYGARFLVRAGKYETVEGESKSRNVVIEFKDYATALACHR